jgi:hypothetical protein
MFKKSIYGILVLAAAIFFYACESNDSTVAPESQATTPTLLSPPNNTTVSSLTPDLDWSDIPSASSYNIQVSTEATFGALILDTAGLTASSYTLVSGVLADSTTYYWRVRGEASGTQLEWSPAFNFNTSQSAVVANDKVLVEMFTNTSCIPCVNANRYLDDIHHRLGITSNDSRVIILRGHTTLFPNDPFYLHNVGDNDARMNYYDAASVNPRVFLMGVNLFGYNATSWTNKINARLLISNTYAIAITNTYDSTARTGSVSVKVTQISGSSVSDLVLHLALAENGIHYSAPNGETEFENTLRDLITPGAGETLNLSAGGSATLNYNYTVHSAVNHNNAELIAFIQDVSSKEVFAAEKKKVK